jgi:hypothetical protein
MGLSVAAIGARHLVLMLVSAAWVLPAHAARLQVEGGRSYMDNHGARSAFVEAVFDAHRVGDSRWTWASDVSLGWIDGREVARYRFSRYGTQDDVWLLAAGARFQHGDSANDGRGWFVSFQPAATHGRTQALSSGYEFVTTLGWQGRRFSVQLRHVSNAGLHEPNRGETMALIGVGFEL